MKSCFVKMSLTVVIACLSLVRSAWAVKADGGYEGNRLPGDGGWVESGSTFLGDYVTLSNGIMTYDGTKNAAPGTSGMKMPRFPVSGGSGTIEYRIRCRAVSGNPKAWYQGFLGALFFSERFAIGNLFGRMKGSHNEAHELISSISKPEIKQAIRPPTSTGTWHVNEWVTIRHIVRGRDNGTYEVECWASGPRVEDKYLDATGEYPPGRPSQFSLAINSSSTGGAVFDLDYIRWSNRAIPWGTALAPASAAPVVQSISPRGGTGSGGAPVTITGANFDALTTITFGGRRAGSTRKVSPHLLESVPPMGAGKGWVDVEASNAAGSDTLSKGFFYGVLPEISSIDPDRGTNLGGQEVTITGSGFGRGARVTFAGTAAPDTRVVDSGTITCRSPAAGGRWRGLAQVTVSNRDGGYGTKKDVYTYERSSPAEPKVLGWLLHTQDHNLPVAIQKLEEMPFHGVLVRPDFARRMHNGTVTQEQVDRETANLKATEFRRFKHNFLFVGFRGRQGPSLGFFEDWSNVIAGYRLYARLCRDIGFRGIYLDFEDYAKGEGADLSYATRNDKSKSFAECEAQVRLRAREVMLAMLGEFPEVQIMTTFGLGTATSSSLDLLPAFYDGMLEGIDSDEAYASARVIDGYESGYDITTPDDYRKAYDRMRKPGEKAYERTTLDRAWADHGSAGFGIYPGGRTVADFRTQLRSSMGQTDEFVWTFTNGNFFMGGFPYVGLNPAGTDGYIQALSEETGFERATPPGRYCSVGHWRMEEGRGTTTADRSVVGFDGTLSDTGIWTDDTPRLPDAPRNRAALDFRGTSDYVRMNRFGYYRRPDNRPDVTASGTGSHLGNFYFADHTIEFSFWWDGKPSAGPQHLYGADGMDTEDGDAKEFAYGGWIPAGTRELVHWQRGNYEGEYGGIRIDLGMAQREGLYRFGRWANVAIMVYGTGTREWKIFLNGKEITNEEWAGVYRDHETVGGFVGLKDNKYQHHNFPLDFVLGARNADELGITDPFNGMLDEFRISAGQVPDKELLSVR